MFFRKMDIQDICKPQFCFAVIYNLIYEVNQNVMVLQVSGDWLMGQ